MRPVLEKGAGATLSENSARSDRAHRCALVALAYPILIASRSSTVPDSAAGQREAISRASSLLSASRFKNPPITSFVSVEGPPPGRRAVRLHSRVWSVAEFAPEAYSMKEQ